MVELKEDDPDAVEYVLRYIYSGQSQTDEDGNWQLQLEVAKTAQKVCIVIHAEHGKILTSNQYLLLDLAAIANEKFMRVASAVIEPEAVFATITQIRQNTLESDHLNVAQQLETKHLLPLLKVPGYRDVIDQDKSIMWNHLDQFRDFMSSQEKVYFVRCGDCNKSALYRTHGGNELYPCLYHRRAPKHQIWIPKGEYYTFERLLKYG